MCYIWTITLIDHWEYPFAHFLPHGNPSWPFLQEAAPSPARSSAGRALLCRSRGGLWWWPRRPSCSMNDTEGWQPHSRNWCSTGFHWSFHEFLWVFHGFPLFFLWVLRCFMGFFHPLSPYSAKYPQHLTPGSRRLPRVKVNAVSPLAPAAALRRRITCRGWIWRSPGWSGVFLSSGNLLRSYWKWP